MRRLNFFITVAVASLLWQGCRTTPPVSSFAFQTNKLVEIEALIEQGIADHRMPGAVVWIEHERSVYHKAFGQRALEPAVEPMTEDTIFDAASLTKVIATTPAIMLLMERGAL